MQNIIKSEVYRMCIRVELDFYVNNVNHILNHIKFPALLYFLKRKRTKRHFIHSVFHHLQIHVNDKHCGLRS